MSMTADFVQVEPELAARIEKNPALAEPLFTEVDAATERIGGLPNLDAAMQERVRTMGPQMFAKVVSQYGGSMRAALEQRLGVSVDSFARGEGGNVLLKVMEERRARAAEMMSARNQSRAGKRLSLEKEWHGIHYLLCGQVESDGSLLGQAVLGGLELGDDEEGFSGYGPARLLTADQVKQISEALNGPDLEQDASKRFDPERMKKLKIYPGFRASDRDGLIEGIRSLKAFYADAAANQRAIVTCIV